MHTLRERVLRAGGWLLAGYASSQLLRLASNLIMTRLLAPEMFGVMAIASMAMMMLMLFSDLGLRQAVVQSRRGDEPEYLDTAWVLQVARGIALWLVALLVSLALALANRYGLLPAGSVYASPELPAVLAVSCFTCAIIGFQSTRVASAQRGLDQRRTIQIELMAQLSGFAVMIPLGLATGSIWSLVAAGLVAATTSVVLSHLWMAGHPNRFRWNRGALGELLRFGRWIFASSSLYVLATHGDRLLLGGLVSAEMLGLYSIALLIVGVVETGLNKLFNVVSLPALSETARKDSSLLRQVYYNLRLPTDLLLLFATGLLFAAGREIIELLYDPRYAGAGPMLEVLALSLFAVRYGVASQVYLALGVPQYQTIMNAARFAALYTLVPALYYFGGMTLALWGIALHSLVIVPLVYAFNARLKLNDWARELLVLPALPAGMACGWIWTSL